MARDNPGIILKKGRCLSDRWKDIDNCRDRCCLGMKCIVCQIGMLSMNLNIAHSQRSMHRHSTLKGKLSDSYQDRGSPPNKINNCYLLCMCSKAIGKLCKCRCSRNTLSRCIFLYNCSQTIREETHNSDKNMDCFNNLCSQWHRNHRSWLLCQHNCHQDRPSYKYHQ